MIEYARITRDKASAADCRNDVHILIIGMFLFYAGAGMVLLPVLHILPELLVLDLLLVCHVPHDRLVDGGRPYP
ncbi:MAG: hypothetical protein MPK62_01130 [Alphaproteobacteria bacterium]|nr:hypothetical protein [Alphaproteobacteria bacterium]